MMLHGDHGSAWRRRQRRLRSWWRHEQQSVAMALSAAAHRSFDKVAAGRKYDGLRAQRTDRAGEAAKRALRRQKSGAAGDAVFFELYDQNTAGWRPTSLAEPLGQVCKPARCSGSWCFHVPDVTMPLVVEEEEEVAVPLLVFQEPVIVQELLEVLVTSSLVRAAQPVDVEQVLDDPVLHMIENDNNLYEFLDLASFQVIPEVQVVDVHVPPGPVPANFVEQVVDVPGRVPLGPVSERIVEQVVDAPVTRDSPFSGFAQQLDARTPAAWLGAPQEQFEGFFALFPPEEKVRKSPRSRVRECTRTRAHPRRLLITMMLCLVMTVGYVS